MDGINEIGKYLKKTAKEASLSLKREVPPQSSIERIRDIFDSESPFVGAITTSSTTKRVTMELNFGRKLPALGCCADCMCGITESYTSDALIGSSIYVTTPYVAGSTVVYLDGVMVARNSDYVEANPETGQISILIPTTTIVISYVYTVDNCTHSECIDSRFDCSAIGFSFFTGLATVFADRFDRPDGDVPSGNCGLWVNSIIDSTGVTTPANLDPSEGTIFLSNKTALLGGSGGGYSSGRSFEILVECIPSASSYINASNGFNSVNFGLVVSGTTITPQITGNWEGYYDVDSFGTIFTFKRQDSLLKFGSPLIWEEDAHYYIRCVQHDGGWLLKFWKQTENEPVGYNLSLDLGDITPEALVGPFDAPIYDYYLIKPTIHKVVFNTKVTYFVLVGAGLDEGDWRIYNGGDSYSGYFCAEIPDGLTRFGYNCGVNGASVVTGPTSTIWPSTSFSLSFPHFVPDADGLGRLIDYTENMASWNTRPGHPTQFRVTGKLIARYPGGNDMGLIPVEIMTYPGTSSQTFFNRNGFNGLNIAYVSVPPDGTPVDVNFIISNGAGDTTIRWGLKIAGGLDALINPLPFLSGPFLFPNNHSVTVSFIEYRVEALNSAGCTGSLCGCTDTRCPTVRDTFTNGSSDFSALNQTYQYNIDDGLPAKVFKSKRAKLVQSSSVGTVSFNTGTVSSRVAITYPGPFDCQFTGDSGTSVEAAFDFKVNTLSPNGSGGSIGFGGIEGFGPSYYIDFYSAAAHPVADGLSVGTLPSISAGTWYSIRWRIVTSLLNIRVSFKLWDSNSTEPTTWIVDNEVTDFGPNSPWSLAAYAFGTADNFIADFRNVSINRVEE